MCMLRHTGGAYHSYEFVAADYCKVPDAKVQRKDPFSRTLQDDPVGCLVDQACAAFQEF